jgi:hypothetical protein
MIDRTGSFAAPSLVAVIALIVGGGVALAAARRYDARHVDPGT